MSVAAEPRRPPSWRARLPWQLRLATKVVALTARPLRSLVERLGGFDHGPMDDADYVRYWVETHVRRAGLESLQGLHVLELGPGDSIAGALVAHGLGAERIVLVDAAPLATRDIEVYHEIAQQLAPAYPGLQAVLGTRHFDELLEAVRAEYLTGGLRSLHDLEPESIDISWSQAVLEHVRADEIDETLRQIRRVHRVGTVSSHRIDLLDHLDRSLHHLRFPARLWNSGLLSRADFYTNRLRKHQLLAAFHDAGFEVEVVTERAWDELPVPRTKLASPFRSMSEDQLRTFEIDVVCRTVRSPSEASDE